MSCTTVGPAAVYSGRRAYNESIVETNNQQLLLLALRNRYGERGNLVPFGAGMIYEENPTIPYSPVGGEKYSNRLMSSLSLRELMLFASNLTDPENIYITFASRINDIYNPGFLHNSRLADLRFSRLIELFVKLDKAHRLHWKYNSESSGRYSIVIDHYWPDYLADVAEIYKLLDLSAPETFSSRMEIPVSLGLDNSVEGGISISTRSIYNLLEIFSAAIDVPEQDQVSGAALSYPPAGLAGQNLRVRRASAPPEGASTAVEYRNA